MRTQVIIIGGGPSGLLLSQLLMKSGIETVVLEKHPRSHVLNRIRAGVIEPGSISILNESGIGTRIASDGKPHSGTVVSFDNQVIRIDLHEATNKNVTVFGQTEITKELYLEQDKLNAKILHNVRKVMPKDVFEKSPRVVFEDSDGKAKEVIGDFIIGCDGFHGISRSCLPENQKTIYENIYPFGWLGILSETPPVHHELIYSNSQKGFALASMRNENLSRYYIQCPSNSSPDDYSDEYFWEELKCRLPDEFSSKLITGKSIEKSIAPLRSFVCEPMQWGNLFLVGDAAHIVPPTGAKGLNLAISDVHYISNALKEYYLNNNRNGLENYSNTALARVWKTVRFSWWMTTMLHSFPASSPFDKKMQRSEFEYLSNSSNSRISFAENYIGLPF
ncbi:MAG: 4-hydroxybenzoate 3-monooxygenase [Rhodobacteraceae bacterium]|nr:MAG: 4-hydroxybenzoate 3-monooxygenase [Paracoccaceae bacterium]